MRPVGFGDSFGRATDTPPILRLRCPPVNGNPRPSPVRRLPDDRSRSRHVTCMNRCLDRSGTPGAPAASIATSRQTTQAVTDVIGRTSTIEVRAALGQPEQLVIQFVRQMLRRPSGMTAIFIQQQRHLPAGVVSPDLLQEHLPIDSARLPPLSRRAASPAPVHFVRTCTTIALAAFATVTSETSRTPSGASRARGMRPSASMRGPGKIKPR
jgi:hypothetical protein